MTDTAEQIEPKGPLLTRQQTAEYLSVSLSTIDNLRRNQELRAVYVCADARYRIDDLDAFIEERSR